MEVRRQWYSGVYVPSLQRHPNSASRRVEIPAPLRVLCLLRYAERCGGCKHSLQGVRFELDHRAALACNSLQQQQDVNKFTNLQPLCGSCHGNKTRCDGSNSQHDHALAPWMAVALGYQEGLSMWCNMVPEQNCLQKMTLFEPNNSGHRDVPNVAQWQQ